MEQRFPLRRTNTPRAKTDWLSCPLLWSSAPPSQNGKNNIIISSSRGTQNQSQATLKTLKTTEGFIYQTRWSDTRDKGDKVDTVWSKHDKHDLASLSWFDLVNVRGCKVSRSGCDLITDYSPPTGALRWLSAWYLPLNWRRPVLQWETPAEEEEEVQSSPTFSLPSGETRY